MVKIYGLDSKIASFYLPPQIPTAITVVNRKMLAIITKILFVPLFTLIDRELNP